MKPLAANIVIRQEPWTTQKAGSIIIPETAKREWSRGEVLAVGPGCFTHNGVQLPPPLKPGDHVLYYTKYAISLTLNGEELHVVAEQNVAIILEAGEFGTEKDI